MTTKILNYQEISELAHTLWQAYAPEQAPYRFQAEQATEAEDWQKQTRLALSQTIGFQNWPRLSPEPQLIETVDRGDYVREKVLIRTTSHALMPVYLLLPKAGPRP